MTRRSAGLTSAGILACAFHPSLALVVQRLQLVQYLLAFGSQVLICAAMFGLMVANYAIQYKYAAQETKQYIASTFGAYSWFFGYVGVPGSMIISAGLFVFKPAETTPYISIVPAFLGCSCAGALMYRRCYRTNAQ